MCAVHENFSSRMTPKNLAVLTLSMFTLLIMTAGKLGTFPRENIAGLFEVDEKAVGVNPFY